MKRAAAKVAKEIAEILKGPCECGDDDPEDPSDHYPVCRSATQGQLTRWLLALSPPPRKVRKKDPARSARRATVKELDALCREVVFLRDGGKCRKCGRSDRKLDLSHVISKGAARHLRHDLDNVKILCAGCHMNWWHMGRGRKASLDLECKNECLEWWKGEIGPDRYRALILRANRHSKLDPRMVKLYLEAERKKYV